MDFTAANNFAHINNLSVNDFGLLNLALTHSSYSNEHRKSAHNERLEYLGDAVLQLTISDYLYRRCPNKAEGYLTKVRSLVVREETLAELARQLKIDRFLQLGCGERQSGGAEKPANLANTVEAVIGALYLDLGFKAVSEQILLWLDNFIERALSGELVYDYKSKIHELAQKYGADLSFILVSSDGPAHKTSFTVDCLWNHKSFGRGRASSKKQAEQQAAAQALKILSENYL